MKLIKAPHRRWRASLPVVVGPRSDIIVPANANGSSTTFETVSPRLMLYLLSWLRMIQVVSHQVRRIRVSISIIAIILRRIGMSYQRAWKYLSRSCSSVSSLSANRSNPQSAIFLCNTIHIPIVQCCAVTLAMVMVSAMPRRAWNRYIFFLARAICIVHGTWWSGTVHNRAMSWCSSDNCGNIGTIVIVKG